MKYIVREKCDRWRVILINLLILIGAKAQEYNILERVIQSSLFRFLLKFLIGQLMCEEKRRANE